MEYPRIPASTEAAIFAAQDLSLIHIYLSVVSSNMAEDMKEIVTFTKWCCSNSEVGHYLERLKDQPKLPTASKDTEGLRPLALTAYKRLNEEYITSGSAGGKKYMARVIISTPNTGNFLQSMTSANYSSSFDACLLYTSRCV